MKSWTQLQHWSWRNEESCQKQLCHKFCRILNSKWAKWKRDYSASYNPQYNVWPEPKMPINRSAEWLIVYWPKSRPKKVVCSPSGWSGHCLPLSSASSPLAGKKAPARWVSKMWLLNKYSWFSHEKQFKGFLIKLKYIKLPWSPWWDSSPDMVRWPQTPAWKNGQGINSRYDLWQLWWK